MENPVRPESKDTTNNAITDTAEIVRRHLQDKNHEITDEEIRNIKVVGEDEAVARTSDPEPSFLKSTQFNDGGEENDLAGEEIDSNTP